jgi:hypothetical protein
VKNSPAKNVSSEGFSGEECSDEESSSEEFSGIPRLDIKGNEAVDEIAKIGTL